VAFDRDQIEAKLALKLIATADMPQVAFDALEAGLDGKAIRRLAILEHPTYFEVAEILPRVMSELGLTEISIEEATLRLAKQLAREILKQDNPVPHLFDLYSLWVRSGYIEQIRQIGMLCDDAYVASCTGSSDEEIRDWVISILKEFVK
jgi:hypothetical protein